MNSAIDKGETLTSSTPGSTSPRIQYEAVWAPEPVWADLGKRSALWRYRDSKPDPYIPQPVTTLCIFTCHHANVLCSCDKHRAAVANCKHYVYFSNRNGNT
jgi:hypothetical protein